MAAPNLDGMLNFRCIGPHRGGRVVAVSGHPHDPMTFYFGAVAGGVWKTEDGGTYWRCISDGFLETSAVGALAVSESDPNVIYAGTGESTIRGNVSHGDGIYKSTDGGKSWRNLGLRDTRHISKIRVHPTNPDLVYVAALGHAWGPNDERGLFRSRDGGEHWEKILYRDPRTGAIDLSLDPTNPRILYCALWEAQRSPWDLTSGGPGSGLFRSTDGGDSWTELTRNEGLPKGVIGKIGVALSPARPERVWALVEAVDGALFRSEDGGETWESVCDNPDLRRRAWYYMHLYADPQDAETCWVLNLQCWRSVDGGKTFTALPTPHGDNHDLWIDPRNPRRMVEGNDGGACVTFNGGASWSSIYNQPTAQFYHVTTDTRQPYHVYGSQQDNTAIAVPSLANTGAITEMDWWRPGGGESGYIAVKPDNPDIVVGGAIGSGWGNGRLIRYDRGTRQERNITVWPRVTRMAEGAVDLKYRFQWTFPVQYSPHDPETLYITANQVLRSRDGGSSWEAISPDLTRNDKSKQQPSGGPITKDNTGAEVYDTIFAFAESPLQQGLFWAGSDDGLVHLSRDGGQFWEDVTPPDLPAWTLVSMIEPSRHDPGTAFVAATRYKLDDPRPMLFKTENYGESWQNLNGNLPPECITRAIREDPEEPRLLFVGSETHLFASFDCGESWQPLQGTLPVTPVYDMVVKDDDLVVATHGRSFWVLDDIAPLRQLAQQSATAPRLFAPSPAVRWKMYEGMGGDVPGVMNYTRVGPMVVSYRSKRGAREHEFVDAGENPPYGVIVSYLLPEGVEGDVTLTFADEQGNEIRRFSSKPEKPKPEQTLSEEVLEEGAEGSEMISEAEQGDEEQELQVPKEPGANRFVWNLRYPDATALEGDEATKQYLPGPKALPGRYTVTLTVAGQSFSQPVQIVADPRTTATADDLRAQFDLLHEINRLLSRLHETVTKIRALRGQLEGWQRRLEGDTDLLLAAKQADVALQRIEEHLVQKDWNSPLGTPIRLNLQLAALTGFVDSGDSTPTQGEQEVFAHLEAEIEEQFRALETVMQNELTAFNTLMAQRAVPAVGA